MKEIGVDIATKVEHRIAFIPSIHHIFSSPFVIEKGRPFDFIEIIERHIKDVSHRTA